MHHLYHWTYNVSTLFQQCDRKLAQVVMFWLISGHVLFDPQPGHPHFWLRVFSVPPDKCWNSISVSSRPFPSISVPIHYSLMTIICLYVVWDTDKSLIKPQVKKCSTMHSFVRMKVFMTFHPILRTLMVLEFIFYFTASTQHPVPLFFEHCGIRVM
jgi:hypothetical protein